MKHHQPPSNSCLILFGHEDLIQPCRGRQFFYRKNFVDQELVVSNSFARFWILKFLLYSWISFASATMLEEVDPSPPKLEDLAFHALVDSLSKKLKPASLTLKFVKRVEVALVVELPSSNCRKRLVALSKCRNVALPQGNRSMDSKILAGTCPRWYISFFLWERVLYFPFQLQGR